MENTFDLASLDTVEACNAGADVEILNPKTNQPTGLTIRVLGRDSDTFRGLVKERANARHRREEMATRRGKPLPPRTVEEIEEENIDLLAKCTLGWKVNGSPLVSLHGEKLEFNEVNVKRVYREYPTVVEQVNEAIGSLELFLKN